LLKLGAHRPQPGQFLFQSAPAVFVFLESFCASFGRGFGCFLVLAQFGFDALSFGLEVLAFGFDPLAFLGLMLQLSFGTLQVRSALTLLLFKVITRLTHFAQFPFQLDAASQLLLESGRALFRRGPGCALMLAQVRFDALPVAGLLL
jgi:hypothetical protein